MKHRTGDYKGEAPHRHSAGKALWLWPGDSRAPVSRSGHPSSLPPCRDSRHRCITPAVGSMVQGRRREGRLCPCFTVSLGNSWTFGSQEQVVFSAIWRLPASHPLSRAQALPPAPTQGPGATGCPGLLTVNAFSLKCLTCPVVLFLLKMVFEGGRSRRNRRFGSGAAQNNLSQANSAGFPRAGGPALQNVWFASSASGLTRRLC